MSMTRRWLLVGFAWLGMTSLMSAAPPPVRPEVKPGMVFLVGGVGGIDFLGPAARLALPSAGVKHELHDFVWTHGKGRLLRDLQDTRHLLTKADRLADMVRRIKEAEPDRPLYLIGHSGGGGLVLATAEQLPPATLERVILLSPAVAPDYDLRAALRATRKEIVSYHSDMDRFWLSWGTSQFGTIDRYYGPAAGRVGFTPPTPRNDSDRELYGRLVQIGWKPEMLLQHHGGTHASTAMPGFLIRHIAPWLKD